MGRIEKTIFLSYRRTNFYTALAVYQDLTAHGYDVFFDYQSIDSGNFAKAILENIEARAHFVLVLSSSALERCSEPNDWLRREIETAMDLKRNIVPLMMEGFDFGSPTTVQALSGKLATLNTYNGLRLYSEYFFDAMEKLRTRYLKVETEDVRSREVSVETRGANELKKSMANEAPQVEVEQITAEEWFERGYQFAVDSKNFSEAFRCFSEAIRLAPEWAVAHYNFGRTLQDLKRYEEAEAAYRKAIELKPDDASAYYNLGSLLDDSKRYDEAEAAYRKAIELKSDHANAYSNLGSLLDDLKRYDEAEAAYHKAIELYEVSPTGGNPDYATTYSNLGNTLKTLKRYDEAEAAYRKAIEINPDYADAYSNLGILLANLKRYDEAETVYRKAIEINPDDANAYYGLACISSNIENIENAFKYLELAFKYLEHSAQYGFSRVWAWGDPDLQWIRDDPRFVEIVGEKPE